MGVYCDIDMNSYDTITNSSQEQHEQQRHRGASSGARSAVVVFAVVAVLVIALFGASVGAAQNDEGADVAASSPGALALAGDDSNVVVADPEVVELEGQLDERDEQISTLNDQLAILQQALIGFGSQEEEVLEAVEAPEALDRRGAEFQEQSRELWRMGYSIGGGENFSAFENTILPCESGTQPDPDLAVGRTDDWGRAQINRPTWKARFESLTGANFEENITNPVLNGFMAAHVEQEQGLSAWTCWRLR